MSAVAWAEFLCGPLSRRDAALAAEIIGRRRDFTTEQATVATRLFDESGRRRGSLVDRMVAAAALADGAAIATANPADFTLFEDFGLKRFQKRTIKPHSDPNPSWIFGSVRLRPPASCFAARRSFEPSSPSYSTWKSPGNPPIVIDRFGRVRESRLDDDRQRGV